MRYLNKLTWQHALMLLPLSILVYLSYLNLGFQVDDALIYQRYIQNWLAGDGLVYNKGEFFNALTSPLYTYLSIFFAWVLGDTQLGAIVLSTLLMAGTLIVVTLLFAHYIPLFFAVLGAVFVASFPFFYQTYGMETCLFVFLLSLSLYLFDKNNYFGLGISLALLLVTRSEGVFLALAMGIEHFRLRRSFPPLHYFIIPVLIVLGVFGFNKFYYGSFLAETGNAKIYQGMSGLWGDWPAFRYINYQIGWFFHNSLMFVYFIMALGILGFIALGFTSLNIVIFTFLVFYTAFYVGLNIPSYHWYYSPYYLLVFFYIAVAIAWLYKNFKAAQDIKFKLLGYALLTIAIYHLSVMSVMYTKNSGGFGDVNHTYRDVGLWIKHNTAPDAKIALIEIGHVGYYSERYLIDILGLVNPFNARFIGELKLSHWLRHYEPDYILTHNVLWKHEEGAKTAALLGDFIRTDMAVTGFRLMKKQSLTVTVLPKQVSEPNELRQEGEQYVHMVHAPGEVMFNLPAGQYHISGEFGLLSGSYINNPHPTDGVTFEVVHSQQNLFQRNLKPLTTKTDRGIQSFTIPTIAIAEPSTLVLRTLPNAHANSDWSFWRNVQITPVPENI